MTKIASPVRQRPTWDEYGLIIARAVSCRGDCTRRQVGAVLLDADNRIIGAGYNGAAPGGMSCLGGDCPRGRHFPLDVIDDIGGALNIGKQICSCGRDLPCPLSVTPGSSYDTGPGACISTHAELNCVMDVDDRSRLIGARMYCTDAPCDGCLKILVNATQIASVRWPEDVLDLQTMREKRS
jgi:dCMP deaminase